MSLSPHASVEPFEPTTSPAGDDERLDENLHFGRAWHRYQYCYRNPANLRVLDAGCGAGRSSVELARLNPEALVLGVDLSPSLVGLAAQRAAEAGLDPAQVRFAQRDLTSPAPEWERRFDFVVCRGVLGHAADPDRLIQGLTKTLTPGGMLLATFPSRPGRQAARALRQAVDALAGPDAGMEGRVQTGVAVVQALRLDHPVRQRLAEGRGQGNLFASDAASDLTRAVVDALDDVRDWSLDEAVAALESAGLRFLYAATRWSWQADRVFDPGALSPPLVDGVARLDPSRLSRLVDALDPLALEDEYALYACEPSAPPVVPAWPHTRRHDPESFNRLVPHPTGLAHPATGLPLGTAAQGRTLFRGVSGALCELDRIAVLRLSLADGVATCGEIDRSLATSTRASDHGGTLQECWVHLADGGLILLEPPQNS
ncbi:MAG: class I SAM-dependent methyltransferase [Isosphaeraceae bacterium]